MCRRGYRHRLAGAGCRVLCPWPGLGGGGGGGGVGVALLVVGGAGVGVVLAGGLGVPVGCVGVACVRRVALAVLDWLWCRGVGVTMEAAKVQMMTELALYVTRNPDDRTMGKAYDRLWQAQSENDFSHSYLEVFLTIMPQLRT